MTITAQDAVILVEGLFVLVSDATHENSFQWGSVGKQLDFKLFLTFPIEAAKIRAGQRKMATTPGCTWEDACAHFDRVDRANDAIITRSATAAHIVIHRHSDYGMLRCDVSAELASVLL